MLLWLLAIVLLGGAATAGYYAGAIRSAFAFLGLCLGSLLCVPLAGAAKPIMAMLDINHPLLVGLLTPVVVWIFIVLVLRSIGEAVHRKIHTYYKYKATDDERLRWERLIQNLGLTLGLVNGTFYLFALCVLIYAVGYLAVQIATPGQDPKGLNLVKRFTDALQQTRMDKAVGSFVPAAKVYCDAADIVGTVYQNPWAQSRLASYPVFLALLEKPEFKVLSTNTAFQEFWLKRPPVYELANHPLVRPLVENPDYYTSILQILGGDLKDLKEYIETGRSPKYEGIKILGRWKFDFTRSYKQTVRSRPTMGLPDRKVAERNLETYLNATLTAFIDHHASLQSTTTNNMPRIVQGTWKESADNKYLLSLEEEGKKRDCEVDVGTNELSFVRDGLTMIFDK